MEHQENSGHPTLKGLAVAAILAAGVGLLLRTEKGQEIKEDIAERAKHVAKQFNKTRKEIQDEVMAAFGSLSDELEEDYLEIQGHLLAKVDDLKDKKELTQEKFEEMSDKLVDKFSKGREWSEDAISNLKSSLRKEWKHIKEA